MGEIFGRGGRYIRHVWTSFWFLPLVLSLAGGLTGYLSISIDETAWARQLADNKLVLAITVDGARSVISTVAGGIITMASLVFSLTFVALTLMSQQLGPRLIQIFVRDRFAQFTFGSFTGSFLYCLFVLAVTGTGKKGEFVPVFSTLLVIVTAIVFYRTRFGLRVQACGDKPEAADTGNVEGTEFRAGLDAMLIGPEGKHLAVFGNDFTGRIDDGGSIEYSAVRQAFEH